MYSAMLAFIAMDKKNVALTCNLLNSSPMNMFLTPVSGNLTLDVIADLSLLIEDESLVANIHTNVTSYLVPKVLTVTDIFQNPSIAMEFNAALNHTCMSSGCAFDFPTSTCTAPSEYRFNFFRSLVLVSIEFVVAKELLVSLATLLFAIYSPDNIPLIFRQFVTSSYTFPL